MKYTFFQIILRPSVLNKKKFFVTEADMSDFRSVDINSSKCVKCHKFLRKKAVDIKKIKIISSRKDAKDFTLSYGLHVQEGDIVCEVCYVGLRSAKSKRLKKSQATSSKEISTVKKIPSSALSSKPPTGALSTADRVTESTSSTCSLAMNTVSCSTKNSRQFAKARRAP